ncbi:MAG: hypothetical protein ACREX3_22945 [Gammaproteobacteria bacterium]
MLDIIGKVHNDLLNWLAEDWWLNGPAVCVIQGFPGVGKNHVAEVLVQRIQKERNNSLAVQSSVRRAGSAWSTTSIWNLPRLWM